ncbi:MAG: ABC transporter permease DevC [Candidatus Binatia bacterium]
MRLPDVGIFDRMSRPEYGPIAEMFEKSGPVSTELADRRITVTGLFTMGTSFGIDGCVVMTGSNFLRYFQDRAPGNIDLGLIQLRDGVDPLVVRDRMRAALPRDVEVLTKADYIERELTHWRTSTPIGFIFTFGSMMGLLVGAVVAYQVLFTDVSAHLPEYATLKAMGYRNWHLYVVVAEEAAILATLGFVPGFLVSTWLYRLTEDATRMPLRMNVELAATVFGLMFLMCTLSGALALRKVRTADPAEIF